MMDYIEHEFNEDGVDLTSIRWMLSLPPQARLEWLQDKIDAWLVARPELAFELDEEDH